MIAQNVKLQICNSLSVAGAEIAIVSISGAFFAPLRIDTYAHVTPEDVIHRRPEPVENSGFPDA